jgi:hypothetical protein
MAAAFAFATGSASGSRLPRFAFDDWERRLSSTSGGIPWAAVAMMLLAAAFAASLVIALRRVIVVRAAARARDLTIAAVVVATLVFVYSASAGIFLATGTRLVPAGSPDDLYAPVEGLPCPPR